MKIVAIAILILASISATFAEQCGIQANGALCPNNLCCSQYGYCGSTPEYCDEGCQSQCRRVRATFAEQCGIQANGALCPNNLCCSQYGYCGSTPEYCEEGCQSQCQRVRAEKRGGIEKVLSSNEFNEMLKHRDNAFCPARGFYTYDAFVRAANSFPEFATTGDRTIQKREIAAFLAQASHYTTGGWNGAPDGQYAWGFCYFLEQGFPQNRKLGLARPDVPTNATLSFQNALSFWMTARPPKPSCHEVMSEQWTPSPVDVEARRLPGFGLTVNIMNGREECGHGEDSRVINRIGFYKRFCDILGVRSYGENLDCNNQIPFDLGRSIGNIFLQ